MSNTTGSERKKENRCRFMLNFTEKRLKGAVDGRCSEFGRKVECGLDWDRFSYGEYCED
jgi:hypothetical protein